MTTERYNVHEDEGNHETCPLPGSCSCECRGCKRAWEAAGRPFSPLASEMTFAELHQLLHRLWTKAVGTMDYDKAEWKRLEKMVETVWRSTGRSMDLRRG
jgi:hypothetical protein